MGGTSVVRLIDRSASKPPKCYLDCEADVVEWILKPLSKVERDTFTSVGAPSAGKHGSAIHKSFDCSIMDLADDISFGIHDFEDMIAMKLISEKDFREQVTSGSCSAHLDYLKSTYPDEFQNDIYNKLVDMLFSDSKSRKHAISRMVGFFVRSCKLITIEELIDPMVRFRVVMEDGAQTYLKALKDFVRRLVIMSPSVQHLEFKGQQMVVAVFEALQSEPKTLLPRDTFEKYEASCDGERVICDHVSGMTDNFLLKTYERLFSPRMGSVFDKL
jgi:dGTPase